MTEETIKKVLKSFGLTDKETELYIFLAKHGALKGGEISKSTKNDRALTYRCLSSLQEKNLVEATLESPARFTAVPFEKLLQSFIIKQREEVKSIENSQKAILDYLKNNQPTQVQERFTVIESDDKINSKIVDMVKETRNELCAVFTIPDLIYAEQAGIFDQLLKPTTNLTSPYCLLITDMENQNIKALKSILNKFQMKVDLRSRNPNLGVKASSRMVIKDNDEALFFIARDTKTPENPDDVCIWTNCKSLVQTFRAVFEDLWKYSIDLQSKINEIEIDKMGTRIFSSPMDSHHKFEEALFSAKKTVTLLIPSESLIEISQNKRLLDKWANNDVSVKIMAPITSEDIQASQELGKHDVRHISSGYLTAIIDGKQLFQSKTSVSTQKERDQYFKDMIQTDNANVIQEIEDTLNKLWKNAQALPNSDHQVIQAAIDAVTQTKGIRIEKDPEAMNPLTERDIIQRIMNARKTPTKSVKNVMTYGICGQAIINPPPHLNLPKMLLWIWHDDKNSTCGEEDYITISSWVKTPIGYAYVPTGFVYDNPEAADFWRSFFKGFQVDVQLLKKEELQVTLHGNSLFAGWTVPLVVSPQVVLQPGCVLLEGYGNVQTAGIVMEMSGYNVKREGNFLEAFVNFLYPELNYSGPGTDGIIARDIISQYKKITF